MNKNAIWNSAVRSEGDLAGVFEFDGDAGHFYLYNAAAKAGQKVLGAIHVISGTPDFASEHVDIQWSRDESSVGLFIRGRLWAAFDSKTGERYGGNYRAESLPIIPPQISKCFE